MCRPFHHILFLALPFGLGFVCFPWLVEFYLADSRAGANDVSVRFDAIPPSSMLFLGFLRGLGRFVCFPVQRAAAYYYYYFLGGVDSEEIFGTNLLRGWVASYLVQSVSCHSHLQYVDLTSGHLLLM